MPRKQTPREEPEDTPSRDDEAWQVVQQYAEGLREIIKKLRKLLN